MRLIEGSVELPFKFTALVALLTAPSPGLQRPRPEGGRGGRGGGGHRQNRNVDGYGNEISMEEIHLARREVERLRGDVTAIDQRIKDISTLRWQGKEQGRDTAMLTNMLAQRLRGKVSKEEEFKAVKAYFLSIKVGEVIRND